MGALKSAPPAMCDLARSLFTEEELRTVGAAITLGVSRDEALRLCLEHAWDRGLVFGAVSRHGGQSSSSRLEKQEEKQEPLVAAGSEKQEDVAHVEPTVGYLLTKAPKSWRTHLGFHPGTYSAAVRHFPESGGDRLEELGVILLKVGSLEEAADRWWIRHRVPLPLHMPEHGHFLRT